MSTDRTPSITPAPSPPVAKVSPKIKLNSIGIPKFNGLLLDYPDFKATFAALTGGQGFTDTVLLIYLKDSLPHSAQHLLVGAGTAQVAWQRLDDRYGNTHQRTLALYEKLVKVELRGKDQKR